MKMYPNNYARFIRKIISNKELTLYGFTKNTKIPHATLDDIVNEETKNIRASTLQKIAKSLGYCDIAEFNEAFEFFEKYGIIAKPSAWHEITNIQFAMCAFSILMTIVIAFLLLS